ncbi:MAG: hypothetical protein IT422_03140 [Pirellulaceae bacterium]|nr:hypothetical protein [Pirellulaceae bacterium]
MMLRRNAFLLACSAIPAICLPAVVAPAVVSTEDDDDREQAEVDQLAMTLALREFASLRANYPDNWQRLSYITDKPLNDTLAAIYCVTSNTKLIDRWAYRVEHAMYPGNLRVRSLGKAGPIEGADDGYDVVTLLICYRESVELERLAFADLKAKYPEPMLTVGTDYVW